jgi:hypothetical protein
LSAKINRRKQTTVAKLPVPDFTSRSFIQAVQEKTAQHYFMASTRKSGGKQLPKEITSDPVFRAIAYCQKWYHDVKTLRALSVEDAVKQIGGEPSKETNATIEKTLDTLRKLYQSQHKPELEELIGRHFVSAAVQGNIERLQELVVLCELHKSRRLESPEMKRYPIPWHYFVGMAACMFFVKGIVPFKKDVIEAAIQHRVVDETVKKYGRKGPIVLDPELKRMTEELKRSEPNWTRIFRDLGLSDLPSALTCPH